MDGNLLQTSKNLRSYLSQHPRVVGELIDVIAVSAHVRNNGQRHLVKYFDNLARTADEWANNRSLLAKFLSVIF